MEFTITINNKEVAVINGVEAGYEAYVKAKEFAEVIGGNCGLVDNATGEVIAWWDFEEDEGF